MPVPLRVLIVEDDEADTLLLLHELRRAGYDPLHRRVDDDAGLAAALAEGGWQAVLADHSLPRYSSEHALRRVQASGLDLPFIIISGVLTEDAAVGALKAGAHDFMVKGNLARLGPALQRELRDAEQRAERRAAETELRLMTEQLIQTARLATMGELAASIAHQLNNPLAIVALRVEQMQARAAPASPEAGTLAAMAEACERMRGLVDHLLRFSQRSVRQVSTLDLCREARDTLEFVRYPFSLRNIACEMDCAPAVPHVRGDRQSLRQVFLNLFNNAGDAMPQGGRLSVRVAPAPGAGGAAVAVEVRDTGRGIAPEELPRVWETFYTTRPAGHGTGLGLSICRRIVQEHGGAIDLASAPGQGTLVRVVLPVQPGVDVA